MIVPSHRLLWVAAAIGVPAATIAGLNPGLAALGIAVLAILSVVCFVDAVMGARRLDRVQLRAPESLRLTKNVEVKLPLSIENRSQRQTVLEIGVVLPEGIESPQLTERTIAPAGFSQIEWPVTGLTRGDHPLRELHVETESPLGLWLARGACHAGCNFRVYPNLRDRTTASLFLKSANMGQRLHRQLGKGREFDNLRHYVPGDLFEDIHWKATARRGYPIVKQYRVEHAQEVYAVLDASRLSAREGILEGYVDAALHLALVAERQGDRFGLVTFSDHTKHFVRARSGLAHFRLCRETLYNLQAERVSPDFREVFGSLQWNLRRRALLVFFTSLDDALLAETFEREIPVIARRHLVLVNVTETSGMQPLFVGDPPESVDSLYENLAGQMLWNRMRKLAIALQNRGVRLQVVHAGKIKAEVAAQYLDTKRRQAL